MQTISANKNTLLYLSYFDEECRNDLGLKAFEFTDVMLDRVDDRRMGGRGLEIGERELLSLGSEYSVSCNLKRELPVFSRI